MAAGTGSKNVSSQEAAPGYLDQLLGSEIAIIGMACRLPGAENPDQFWRNLCEGVESLTELSDEELRRSGVEAARFTDPAYVRRAALIDGIEEFDARFFGYTPQEATIMDPQHRLFLECAWEVFEQAGYDPQRHPHPVGVFTGAKTNTYLFNVVAHRARFPALDNFQIALGNDLAAMATRISYKLNLRGPSYALHTACSTSLAAVHLACQSLLLDECAMAVAGGAAINVPQHQGYTYQKGGILSPDGSSRTFDARAAGCNFGNGVGAVLLKRLDAAIAEGDPIYAVIRGSAANNDGAEKASFTAPGVEGQTDVLLEAMACAGVQADSLSYLEAHGTATELGDSIEILALSQAFRTSTQRTGFCAIGSVKTNIGHLETAAGIAGLIKTALALHHRQIPPSLHFETPNPKIDFENSPFYVNTTLAPWPPPPQGALRRAGVSSFGIGSTNVHVILEQAPPRPRRRPGWCSPAARRCRRARPGTPGLPSTATAATTTTTTTTTTSTSPGGRSPGCAPSRPPAPRCWWRAPTSPTRRRCAPSSSRRRRVSALSTASSTSPACSPRTRSRPCS
ncbi:MAG: polyketide synthase [bacterium]|nr:polyketide synthase [bacterium]